MRLITSHEPVIVGPATLKESAQAAIDFLDARKIYDTDELRKQYRELFGRRSVLGPGATGEVIMSLSDLREKEVQDREYVSAYLIVQQGERRKCLNSFELQYVVEDDLYEGAIFYPIEVHLDFRKRQTVLYCFLSSMMRDYTYIEQPPMPHGTLQQRVLPGASIEAARKALEEIISM